MKSILAMAFAVLAFISCDNKEEVVVNFSKPNLVYPKSGGSIEVGITVNGAWSATVDSNADWITKIEPMSGDGDATLTITVSDNETGEKRSGNILINEYPLLVSQEEILMIDDTALVGVWKTDDSRFNFNFKSDKSCTATVNSNPAEGSYTVNGNIVTVTVPDYQGPGQDFTIVIVVQSITDSQMNATAFGQPLVLKKQ